MRKHLGTPIHINQEYPIRPFKMVLKVGHIEHVHRIRLPLASSGYMATHFAASEAARKTFAQEGA